MVRARGHVVVVVVPFNEARDKTQFSELLIQVSLWGVSALGGSIGALFIEELCLIKLINHKKRRNVHGSWKYIRK